MSFRLLSLEVEDHPALGRFQIDLTNKIPDLSELFICLIIGPNGTGKSKILRIVIDIFREIELIQHNKPWEKVAQFKYKLVYKIGEDIYSIEKKSTTIRKFTLNQEECFLSQITLPSKILALSYMINDKFLFLPKKNENETVYQYLGIRNTANSASTKSYVKRVVEDIFNLLGDLKFIQDLRNILKFLDYDNFLNIRFKLKSKKFLFSREGITQERLTDYFQNWKSYRTRRKTIPFSAGYFPKLSSEDIRGLVDLINSKRHEGGFFEFDVLSEDMAHSLSIKKQYSFVKIMMKLDLLTAPEIVVKKKDLFNLSESSSGEFHFLATMISIMSNIEPNSLILIDEPEISLHPTWQEKYIHFIKNIFFNYSSCSFVIATHSHFLISDLKEQSSSIISLKRNNEKDLTIHQIESNTYGGSAEDILYNIFEVPTNRNYYLASEIGDILNLVSKKEENFGEIKRRVIKLKEVKDNLNDIDPLKQILTKLLEKYG